MRSSLETSSFRVVLLASGLAVLSAACGGGSGTPNGAGGHKADAGSDAKGTGGATGTGGKTDAGGDVKADSGTGGMGMGGKVDAGPDSGAGGMVVVDSGVDTGPMLNPPWRGYWPLVMTSPGGTASMGMSPDIGPNHYDATWFGSTVSFMNGSVNLTGMGSENIVVPPKVGVPVVDVTGSYSVQAWVTLKAQPAPNPTGFFQTVVSGEGFNIASFFLQKRVDLGGAWFFTTQAGDSIGSANCISPPTGGPDAGPQNPVVAVPGTLYHLVATRDGTSGTQILYVNGAESGRNTCPAGFMDTGVLGIGHSVFNNGRVDQVTGTISDVGVINRVLTPTEVTMLFNKGRTYVPPPPPDAGPDVPANDGGTDAPSDASAGDGATD